MRIAIVGAGLAGSALAVLLRRAGADVTLFDDGRRPELIVGESLVPAVIPLLARLGVEPETASFSQVKPGVSFVWSPSERFSFSFARFAPTVPPYAYNVPRPRFDDALRAAAVAAGAERVVGQARVVRVGGASGAELALAPDTLAAAPRLGGRQPDLVVDATGRARLGARALGIQARLGPRSDVAHFAHFEGWDWDDEPGQVVIARLAAGWSWCIPLRDRLSVGIVVPRDEITRFGVTPDERLERAITLDPYLKSIAGGARRVTDVATYANYQLVSERGHGPGWVMVGDAFGFVDPMLSPGVFVALHSAELVAEGLAPWLGRGGVPTPVQVAAALRPYAATQTAVLEAWSELITYFYDGRMSALFRAGRA
ncbi:MAG: tryptophan 7-halogenase, partial [Candidatus Rokubacteria bacterium]|nr:tryptophan 7-halogenase [Candidatus Rokubacteria bacterium]